MARWSRDYDACVECGTTEIKHKGHGLCMNCYARNRWWKNPEERRKHLREYRKRPEVKAKLKEYEQRPNVKKRRLEIATDYRERNKELCLERTREWRDVNREYIKQYNNRPDIVLRRKLSIAKRKYGENAEYVLLRDNFTCQKCGGLEAHIHHIDWDETNDEPDNMIVLCNSCHRKLHSWVPVRLRREVFLEWMETQ